MLTLLKNHFSPASEATQTEAPAKPKKRKKQNYPDSVRRWSKCEREAVVLLRENGRDWKEIAEYVGHTPGSTQQTFYNQRKGAKQPAPKPPKPPTAHKRVIAAIKSGANTQMAIAEATGLHVADVSHALRDLKASNRIKNGGYVEGPFGRPRSAYSLV